MKVQETYNIDLIWASGCWNGSLSTMALEWIPGQVLEIARPRCPGVLHRADDSGLGRKDYIQETTACMRMACRILDTCYTLIHRAT